MKGNTKLLEEIDSTVNGILELTAEEHLLLTAVIFPIFSSTSTTSLFKQLIDNKFQGVLNAFGVQTPDHTIYLDCLVNGS